MSGRGWHILREGARLTLARRLPARFDIEAATCLPFTGRGRLAAQIRQDVWRALQGQRGFSPVVEITAGAEGLAVRAGGRVENARFDREGLERRVAEVLASPANRRRWLRGNGGGR